MTELSDMTFEAVEARIDAALAAEPDGVIERIAAKAGTTPGAVLARLPGRDAVRLDGTDLASVWNELTGWGDVLVIVHTAAGVFEIDTALMPGTVGQGYFNVGSGAALHGHIAASRCAAIYCVDRLFFGRRSCSIQFVDGDGTIMFKIFVRRSQDRSLDPAQLALFEALRDRAVPAAHQPTLAAPAA